METKKERNLRKIKDRDGDKVENQQPVKQPKRQRRKSNFDEYWEKKNKESDG